MVAHLDPGAPVARAADAHLGWRVAAVAARVLQEIADHAPQQAGIAAHDGGSPSTLTS